MSLAGLTGHLVALTLSFLNGRDCVRVTSLCTAFTTLKNIPLNLWGCADKFIHAIQFYIRRTFVMNLSLAHRIGLFPSTRKTLMSAESPRFILGARVELGGPTFNAYELRAQLPLLKHVKDLLINISPWRASTMGEQLVWELLNMLTMIPNLRSLCLAADYNNVEPIVPTSYDTPEPVPKPKTTDISCCLQRLDMRVPFLQSWPHMKVVLNACPGLLELDVSSNELVTLTGLQSIVHRLPCLRSLKMSGRRPDHCVRSRYDLRDETERNMVNLIQCLSPGLTTLDISDRPKLRLSRDSFMLIARCLPQLQQLYLGGHAHSRQLVGVLLKELPASLPHLKRLDVSGHEDETTGTLGALTPSVLLSSHLQHLQHLHVNNLALEILDVDIVMLAENMGAQLRSIMLSPGSRCDDLSDASVVVLLLRCTRLKMLCLPQSKNITERWVARLPRGRHWPQLHTLWCEWGQTGNELAGKFCGHFSKLQNLKIRGLCDDSLSVLVLSLQLLTVLDARDGVFTIGGLESALVMRGPCLKVVFVDSCSGPDTDPRLKDARDRAQARAMAMAHTHMHGANAISPNQRWTFAQAMAAAQLTALNTALRKARQEALLTLTVNSMCNSIHYQDVSRVKLLVDANFEFYAYCQDM